MAESRTIEGPEVPHPFEPIAIDLAEADIKDAMAAYQEFLHLPRDERERVSLFDESRPRTGYSGYKLTGEGDGDDRDSKHYFHMTTALAEWRQREWLRLPPEGRQFLDVAEELYRGLDRAVKDKYTEWQEEMPCLVGIHFPKGEPTQHHLRFLAYRGTGEDGVLARGHYDKGTATVAVAESHGGLRLGISPDDLQLVDRGSFDPIIFPAYGWNQLAEALDVPTSRRAAWHDVIDTGERVTDEVIRWALIFFIDPAHIYLESTKAQTHTPIPWRGMGKVAMRSDGQSFWP